MAALLTLPAPWWVWSGALAWLALWLTAILGLSDGASRGFLAGTLRKSTYTQIYTTLTRRNVMALWRRLCTPADDRAPLPALFRAALTWRLYDAALLIAVAYPIALPVLQWVVTGEALRVGATVLIEPAWSWTQRVSATSILIAAIYALAKVSPILPLIPLWKSFIAIFIIVLSAYIVGFGIGVAVSAIAAMALALILIGPSTASLLAANSALGAAGAPIQTSYSPLDISFSFFLV